MGEGLRRLTGLLSCGQRGTDGVDGSGVWLVAKSLLVLISSPILAQPLLQNAGCILVFGGSQGAGVEDGIDRCGRAECFAVGPDTRDDFDFVG